MEEILAEKAKAAEAFRCSPTFASRFLHYYSLFIANAGGAPGVAPAPIPSSQFVNNNCSDHDAGTAPLPQHMSPDARISSQLGLSMGPQIPAANVLLPATITPELLLQHPCPQLLFAQLQNGSDAALCPPIWPDHLTPPYPQFSPTQIASQAELCTPTTLAQLLAEHNASAIASTSLAPGLVPPGSQFPFPGSLAGPPSAETNDFSQAIAALAANSEPTANATTPQSTGTTLFVYSFILSFILSPIGCSLASDKSFNSMKLALMPNQ